MCLYVNERTLTAQLVDGCSLGSVAVFRLPQVPLRLRPGLDGAALRPGAGRVSVPTPAGTAGSARTSATATCAGAARALEVRGPPPSWESKGRKTKVVGSSDHFGR